VSTAGAAAASAAARRRGDASRKAKRRARAPEGDTPARLTSDTTMAAHSTESANDRGARSLPRRRGTGGRPFLRSRLSRA
jgi:hypothetical protein